MNPDPLANSAENPQTNGTTAGLTTKVVKGSVWTLAGQVAPLVFSFVASPFVIRLLGSEAYGALILIGLIPTYFSFADFGMGLASTKFGSEAYADRDAAREARVIRTAAAIALATCLPVGIVIFAFSGRIIGFFNVPEHLHTPASIGLKLAAVAYVIGILSSVMNSPLLARLRMDLTTIIGTIPRTIVIVATPIALYLGFGIVGAVTLTLAAAVVVFTAQLYFSGKLLPELFNTGIDRNLLRPLVKFGGAWIIAMIAAMLLVNFEKLALSRLVSVESLAHYSVAFTFANMAITFSSAMLPALVPAFSQLASSERHEQFSALFGRGIRLNLILLLPTVMFLFVIARPFFTIWFGPEFGEKSTLPFYILLFGLFFNILAYIPHSSITAKGRTDIFAKLYWFELVFYVVIVLVLISSFGIIGAAAAWSIRVMLDAAVVIFFCKRITGVDFSFARHFRDLLFGVILLMPPMLFAAAYDNFSLWLLLLAPLSAALYAVFIWRTFIGSDERTWLKSRADALVKLLKLRPSNGI